METPLQPITTEKLKLIGTKDLILKSWVLFTSNIKLFAIILSPILVAPFLLFISALSIIFLGPLGFIVFIVGLFVSIIVNLWVAVSLLFAVREKGGITAKKAFSQGWRLILPYFWLSFLLGFITFGGFMLFFIPGLVLSIWFSVALYVFISEDMRGMNALLRSKQLVQGYWWSVFSRFLIFGLLMLGIFLPFVILNFILEYTNNSVAGVIVALTQNIVGFILTPFALVFGYLLYENLKEVKNTDVFVKPSTGAKIKYLAVGFIGVVGILGFLLTSIVLVSLSSARERAQDARNIANMQLVRFSLESYYAESGNYPSILHDAGSDLRKDFSADRATGLPYE